MVKAILLSKRKEADNIMSFDFSVQEKLNYIPGQYVMLGIKDEYKPFSILDLNGNNLKIMVSKKGLFTQALFNSTPKDVFDIKGPYGRFTLEKSRKTVVMIAGGIGITPLYSMLKGVTSEKRAYLFYSTKKLSDMSLYDELKNHDNTNLFLTQEAREGFINKRIDIQDINKVPDYIHASFYICGPLEMINSLTTELINSGVNPEQVFSEDFDR